MNKDQNAADTQAIEKAFKDKYPEATEVTVKGKEQGYVFFSFKTPDEEKPGEFLGGTRWQMWDGESLSEVVGMVPAKIQQAVHKK